jgi:hypothetical protein
MEEKKTESSDIDFNDRASPEYSDTELHKNWIQTFLFQNLS